MKKFDWSEPRNGSHWSRIGTSWRLVRLPDRDECLGLVERAFGMLQVLLAGALSGRVLEVIQHQLDAAREGRRPDPKMWPGTGGVEPSAGQHLAEAAHSIATLGAGIETCHSLSERQWYVAASLEAALGRVAWKEGFYSSDGGQEARANYRARMAVLFGDLVVLGDPVPED